MTKIEIISLIFILIVIILFIAIAISIFNYNKSVFKIVIENSLQIKELNKINNSFNSYFEWELKEVYSIHERYNTKQKYDRTSPDKFCFEHIYDNLDFYDDLINKFESNIEINNNYIKKYYSIKDNILTELDCEKLNIPFKKAIKYEKKFYQKNKIKPIINFALSCHLSYTSPQGRNSYSKEQVYYMNDIKQIIEKSKLQLEYNQTKEARKKFERNKLTKSLRYDVLRRDNFKCVICGRTSQDGAFLHVDHILPIARGGETKLDNLQTLCENCNLGKGIKD